MNKLVKISDLFEAKYGVNLELINLDQCNSTEKNAIPFVSRTEKNNGVSAFVYEMFNIEPNPAHTLSVAVSGSVLSTFYQPKPYYSGRDLYVLIPKKDFSTIEMLFYAKCISTNKYRYSYGRQANKTLRDILLPKTPPTKLMNDLSAFKNVVSEKLKQSSILKKTFNLDTTLWDYFDIVKIFGKPEKCKCSNASDLLEGNDIYYIGAKKTDNGVMQKVELVENLVTKGNRIVFIGNGQGSVGYSTYQPIDFIGSTSLSCGYNENLNPYNGLFIVTVLDLERYRYNYGRGYGKAQLSKTKIKLPAKNGKPDWQFMEDYIKSVPYSNLI
jgi:hypothetical protein